MQPAAEVDHLVILCIDTLRADHVGAYGYERDTTPTVDALAAEGVVFEDAIAHSPWTVPATASLLTGLLPSEHGAGVEGEIRHLGEMPVTQLRAEARTLAEILQQAGFRTGLFSANPFLHGRFKDGFAAAEVDRQSATDLTDKALDWLRQTSGERSFLYLQFMDLHQPIVPPPPYFEQFPAAAGGARTEQHTDWQFGQLADPEAPEFVGFRDHKLALYDGALRYVDAEVARILEALQELDLARRTLLIVTSDHGEEFWDHWEIERRLGGDPRQLWGIGHGHSMFQELLRVPLIFHGPGVDAGRRIDCPTRQIDVLPTVLSILGVEAPQPLRGRSLVPWLAGAETDCEPLPLIAESPAYGPDARAVVWKGRKLIARDDGVRLLYDLRRDPGEMTDLAAGEPDLVAGLEALLAAELVAPAAPGESEEMEFDPATEEQLRALGYID